MTPINISDLLSLCLIPFWGKFQFKKQITCDHLCTCVILSFWGFFLTFLFLPNLNELNPDHLALKGAQLPDPNSHPPVNLASNNLF